MMTMLGPDNLVPLLEYIEPKGMWLPQVAQENEHATDDQLRTGAS
jgi:hypothetical protein